MDGLVDTFADLPFLVSFSRPPCAIVHFHLRNPTFCTTLAFFFPSLFGSCGLQCCERPSGFEQLETTHCSSG